MFRFTVFLIGLCLLNGWPAVAKDILRSLAPEISDYARELDLECKTSGFGHVVLSDNFDMAARGPGDLNGDGRIDHLVYKCMFGCSEKPAAFTGIGSPCPWGNLLMSGKDRYEKLFLPGVVNKVFDSDPLMITVTRPRTLRLHGNYCQTPQINYNPQYLYKLEEGWFQVVGMCPETGCETLLSDAGPATSH